MTKQKAKKIQESKYNQWIVITAIASVVLLPLIVLSPRIRKALLQDVEIKRNLRIIRSRLSGKIIEIIIADRVPVSAERDLLPIERIINVFYDVVQPIGSFGITQRWVDDRENLRSTEVKSKNFLTQAIDESYLLWKTAVAEENQRVLEIEPRGVRFVLRIRMVGKGRPRVSVSVHGDSKALEKFGEAYLNAVEGQVK